jgi:hypothetical protein
MEQVLRRIAMPRIPDEVSPVGAVYLRLGRIAEDPWLRPLLVFWEDGRVVWSRDAQRAGPPYFGGNVKPKLVLKLLDDLESYGAFNSPARYWPRFPPDSSHYTIVIAAGSRRLYMGSWDRQPEGADRSELDRQFCQLWAELDRVLMSLRPKRGRELGNVEFKLDWLP